MVTDSKTNGNYKKETIDAGQGILIEAEDIHRVTLSDGAIVKAILLPPIDSDLPEQGETQKMEGLTITGIYSDKDIKIVKACGGKSFPKHSHPGKEWLEVVKGKITIYHYRELLAIGLIFFIFVMSKGIVK